MIGVPTWPMVARALMGTLRTSPDGPDLGLAAFLEQLGCGAGGADHLAAVRAELHIVDRV